MIRLRTDLFDNLPTAKIYDNEDNYLGETNNVVILDDFRRQIKNEQATGYYMIYEGEKIKFDRNGTPQDFPAVFDTYTNILLDLV